ncbi:hypothetical protein B0H16DRAFT_390084 [Mycena metata]|uniref:SET domain-containing protein n=1 Tax=Mycena metata TaxID=1033252 RepID=A0AAD7MJC1_9AGAR|nr:hypothetical protein B0H16DRAFT_390084 [Mycena metata]
MVSMRVIVIAGVGPRQFAIIAEEVIPPLTTLRTPVVGPCRWLEPLQLVRYGGLGRCAKGPDVINHSCAPNARVSIIYFIPAISSSKTITVPLAEHGNGHTVTVRTNNNIIQGGKEITVSYGRGFWTPENSCLCSVCLPRDPNPVQRDTVQLDSAEREAERQPKKAERNKRRCVNEAKAKGR